MGLRPLIQHERAMWLLLAIGGGISLALGPMSRWEPIGLVAFLLALVIAADLFSFAMPGKGSLTPMASGLVLAMMFLGPLPAVAIALISSIVDGVRRRLARPATLANTVCHVWLAAGLGAGVHDLANQVQSFDAGPFALGAATYLVFSTLTFVWVVFGWSTDPIRRRFQDQYVPLLPPELLVALLTGGAAELYSRHDDAALAVLAAAIVVFQYMSRQVQVHDARATELGNLAATQRGLLGRITQADSTYRRALAQELHDGPLQALLAARQDAAEVARYPERAVHLERALAAAIKELRETTLRLHPLALRDLGFERSVTRFAELIAERHHLALTVAIGDVPDPGSEDLVSAIVFELLSNVGKHAGAASVVIEAGMSERSFFICVTDDGKGFGSAERKTALENGHIGLAVLAERVRGRGGVVDFEPGNSGTRVRVTLPRHA